MYTQDFEDVLKYIDKAIDQDVEQFSENGADRMFQHLSGVFQNLFMLLERAQTSRQADELVSCTCVNGIRPQCAALQCLARSVSKDNLNQMLHCVQILHAC